MTEQEQRRRKQEIGRIGEEWKDLADTELSGILLQLERSWCGEAAGTFLEKGEQLKASMKKTGEDLLERRE